MSKHKHYYNMMLFANDARHSEHPEQNWEMRVKGNDEWQPCVEIPSWKSNVEYRQKVNRIHVGKMSFPEPQKHSPIYGSTYFYVSTSTSNDKFTVLRDMWTGNEFDIARLNMGVVHISYLYAQEHADVLSAVCHGEHDV